jgi:hypothetical protein
MDSHPLDDTAFLHCCADAFDALARAFCRAADDLWISHGVGGPAASGLRDAVTAADALARLTRARADSRATVAARAGTDDLAHTRAGSADHPGYATAAGHAGADAGRSGPHHRHDHNGPGAWF